MAEVDAIKRNIIQLCQEDFRKIDPSGGLGQPFITLAYGDNDAAENVIYLLAIIRAHILLFL